MSKLRRLGTTVAVSSKKRLGLIVNPIAGMGGSVALKGTDGKEILDRAIELGAVPVAPKRAVEALGRLVHLKKDIEILTYPYDMGEYEVRECTMDPIVMGSITKGETTSRDTRKAASDLLKSRADLILFAGGDGTARDVFEVVDQQLPVVGIPAGVKIHSGVFAINPRAAGELAGMYLQQRTTATREAEVMDVDEQAFRENRLSAKLYGYLRIPCEETLVQNPKATIGPGEEAALDGIACEIIENMDDDCVYVFGPGTTTRAILERLGLKKTLLGVDVVRKRQVVGSDVNERQLLKLIERGKTKIVVTIIGGQGFIFGRGTQQISPEIIRLVGRQNILVVATLGKLASLGQRPLLVDTGDEEVDRMMAGYVQVTTGHGTSAVYKTESD